MSKEKKILAYYAHFEVVVHNTFKDCWVSLLGKVLDITDLIAKHKREKCIKPLLAMAGKDISHWFDERTKDIKYFVHPLTGCKVPFCPWGFIPDVGIDVPSTDWRPLNGPPWWLDEKYQIGWLTKKVRPLRIINMICPTHKQVQINVCQEDTFNRIQERYSMFNSDASSYTWRYCDRNLDMNKTMDENGIPDLRDKFTELNMSQDFYIPSVFLYYNDDLKHFEINEQEVCPEMPLKCNEIPPRNKM